MRYLARSQGALVTIRDSSIQFRRSTPGGRGTELSLTFEGASSGAQWEAQELLTRKTSYLVGNQREKWIENVPNFGRIVRKGLYPKIDLVIYGAAGQVEYDLILHAGADPSAIHLRFGEGAELSLTSDGDLAVQAGEVRLLQRRPAIFQQNEGGGREEVDGGYRLTGWNTAEFRLGPHDPEEALIIDPVLVTATLLGGSGDDRVIFSDPRMAIVGTTTSTDFPGATGQVHGTDIFVYSAVTQTTTIIGGSGDDFEQDRTARRRRPGSRSRNRAGPARVRHLQPCLGERIRDRYSNRGLPGLRRLRDGAIFQPSVTFKGFTGYGNVSIEGLASSGTVDVTYSGAGITGGKVTMPLAPSGFVWQWPSFTLPSSLQESLAAYVLGPVTLLPLQSESLRPGVTGSVTFTSSNPSVAAAPAPFTASATSLSSAIAIPAKGPGTAQITIVQPPGFTNPPAQSVLQVTVLQPSITLQLPPLSRNGQVAASFSLPNFEAGGTYPDLTLTSGDPSRLLVSLNQNNLGSASVTVKYQTQQGIAQYPQVYLQALDGPVDVPVTLSLARRRTTFWG